MLSVYWLPPLYFSVAIALLTAVLAWEWAALADASFSEKLVYVLLLLTCLFLIAYSKQILPILIAGLGWWLVACLCLFSYPRVGWLNTSTALRLLAGLFALLPGWAALHWLRMEPEGITFVFFALFIVWSSDIGGYFAGRLFGRRRLAVRVSPNKTLEGVAGSLLASFLVAGIIGYLAFDIQNWLLFFWITLLLVMASVLGDLTESMMKRIRGVKDSGNWLPGHGGLLDRVDALMAAAPVLALTVYCGWFPVQSFMAT